MRIAERIAEAFGYELRAGEPRPRDYTEQLVAAHEAQASGQAAARQLAVVEACASLWSRVLAAATVKPEPAAAVLTPYVRAMAGRSLFVNGEAAFRLRVRRARLALDPVLVSDVRGRDPDPARWDYLLHEHVPSGAIELRALPARDILHARYSPEPSRPWRGTPPLERAGADVRVLGGLALRIGEQSRARAGQLVGLASTLSDEASTDIMQQIAGSRGGASLVGDTTGFHAVRYGFAPDAEARHWAADTERRVWAAAGVSPAMFLSSSDGTAAREAFRRFTATTAAYLGDLIAEEASLKLEMDVTLSFEKLRGSDIQGIGRAVKSLVDAGASYEDALVQAGLV